MKQTLLLVLFSVSLVPGQSQPAQSTPSSQSAPTGQTAPAGVPPAKKYFEMGPIDKLKSTESAHFDPALPPQNFGRWFRRLIHPSVANYEERDCGTAAADAKPDAPKPKCMFVTAALPQGRFLNLKFSFDAEHNIYNYVSGSLTSSDPENKQPPKTIQKLSELLTLIHPEGQGS